ncbi:MAG: protein phosphatase 2C domain-containing protein [Woeseiaceae bacterium]|nr:protein phosphatase 2C domain-containing protein [Woeseiaceae bacterium]
METAWQWVSSGVTDVGNVRKVNEDAILDRPQSGLWVVADGMGGHAAGDVASSSIVTALSALGEYDRPRAFVDAVEDCIIDVNRRLYDASSAAGNIMGSTVAAVLALPGYALCMWAGDSRVYRLRNYVLEELTTDHSEVEELIAEGSLRREDADNYPGENVITRAVGGEPELYLEVRMFELRHKDRFLLCSDGLYKDITFKEIETILSDGAVSSACQQLLSLAKSRRCSDNVSIIGVDFELR